MIFRVTGGHWNLKQTLGKVSFRVKNVTLSSAWRWTSVFGGGKGESWERRPEAVPR